MCVIAYFEPLNCLLKLSLYHCVFFLIYIYFKKFNAEYKPIKQKVHVFDIRFFFLLSKKESYWYLSIQLKL